jgi:hypothetical protein
VAAMLAGMLVYEIIERFRARSKLH